MFINEEFFIFKKESIFIFKLGNVKFIFIDNFNNLEYKFSL